MMGYFLHLFIFILFIYLFIICIYLQDLRDMNTLNNFIEIFFLEKKKTQTFYLRKRREKKKKTRKEREKKDGNKDQCSSILFDIKFFSYHVRCCDILFLDGCHKPVWFLKLNSWSYIQNTGPRRHPQRNRTDQSERWGRHLNPHDVFRSEFRLQVSGPRAS